jgi:tRNA(His) 5'-end guanylyltransferase
MRLDGKAFHTVTAGMDKPFDENLAWVMDQVARMLAAEVQGTVFGYTQSDEISLLLQDFESIGTEPWFDGNVQKMTSISAAIASVRFNGFGLSTQRSTAYFDSRVFTISDPVEVANYFIWRQRDAVRNSILALAQAQFGPKRVHGVNTTDLLHMLNDEGVHWTEMPGRFTHGAQVIKYEYYVDPIPPAREAAIRTGWLTEAVDDAWTVNHLMPLIPQLHGGEDTEGEDRQSDPEPAKSHPGADTERGQAAEDR